MDTKIIKRIKSLLAKTIKNGATAEESASAIKKASELMLKYNIKQAELDSKPQFDIIKMDTPFNISASNLSYFGLQLANIFDCKLTFSRYEKKVSFYGHREDVELCIFSLITLTKLSENELKKYKKTNFYKTQISIQKKGAGRILCNSFRKGFFFEIGSKLQKTYEERNITIKEQNKYALVLKSKIEKVDEEYKKMVTVTKSYTPRASRIDATSFKIGQKRGRKAQIQKGLL